MLDVENDPVIVYAKVMKGGLPILGADAQVQVYLAPGEGGDSPVVTLSLRDDGLGMWSYDALKYYSYPLPLNLI